MAVRSFSCSASGTRGNAPVPTHGSVGACVLRSPHFLSTQLWSLGFFRKSFFFSSRNPQTQGVTQNTGAEPLCLPLAAQGSRSPPSGDWGWGPLGCVPSRRLLGRLHSCWSCLILLDRVRNGAVTPGLLSECGRSV